MTRGAVRRRAGRSAFTVALRSSRSRGRAARADPIDVRYRIDRAEWTRSARAGDALSFELFSDAACTQSVHEASARWPAITASRSQAVQTFAEKQAPKPPDRSSCARSSTPAARRPALPATSRGPASRRTLSRVSHRSAAAGAAIGVTGPTGGPARRAQPMRPGRSQGGTARPARSASRARRDRRRDRRDRRVPLGRHRPRAHRRHAEPRSERGTAPHRRVRRRLRRSAA